MDYTFERSREEIKSVGELCLIGRVLERIGFSDVLTRERISVYSRHSRVFFRKHLFLFDDLAGL